MKPSRVPLSVLDLCPLLSGQSATESVRGSLELARQVDALGYRRYWFAEHHNMAGIASTSPEVLIGHVAQVTRTIRVGSGGVMLPNHAPLRVAETFRTLEALHPGRIDLGLGRAPGSGASATVALRGREGLRRADDFPSLLQELFGYLTDGQAGEVAHPGVAAFPNGVGVPEVWILGSSDYGARLAGELGLPYAFAQHFSSLPAGEVMRLYRRSFQPSVWLKDPRALLATHVICADTDEEARELAISSDLSFHLFRQTGKSIPLPTVTEAKAYGFSPSEWDVVRATSMPKFVGSPGTIRGRLDPVIEETGADELMALSMIHDQEARRRSYDLLARAFT